MPLLSWLKGVGETLLNRFDWSGEPISPADTDITDVSNGVLSEVGPYRLYNNATGELMNLGIETPVNVQLFETGNLQLMSSIPLSSLNVYRSMPEGWNRNQPLGYGQRISLPGVSGQFEVTWSSGQTTVETVDFASAVGFGERWTVTGSGENAEFSRSMLNYRTNIELQTAVGTPDVRYATPTEVTEIALRGYFFRRGQALVDQLIADAGLEDIPGGQTAGSQAVDLLVNIAKGQVSGQIINVIGTH